MRPQKDTYPDYYGNYIPLVKENSVHSALDQNLLETVKFYSSIPSSKENVPYELGKWTVKQVMNHIIDTERIFAYRALRFARGDEKQPLSFEQDDYVNAAELEKRNLSDLVNEFESVRRSTISLFQSFSDQTLLKTGNTAAGKVTVLAIGFVIAGHAVHHTNVVRERYLKK